MKTLKWIFTMCLMLLALCCFAMAADVVGQINSISDKIPLSAGWMTFIGGLIVELGMRYAPTKKAIGLIHVGAAILIAAAALLVKVAKFSDALLPQNSDVPQVIGESAPKAV